MKINTPKTLKKLDLKVWNICLLKKKDKDHPAVVVGALLNSRTTSIEENGFPPPPIAMQLQRRLARLGNNGDELNGNKIGKCAEVGAANKILRTRPTVSAYRIKFTNAYRPRTMDKIEMCLNCIETFK